MSFPEYPVYKDSGGGMVGRGAGALGNEAA